MTIVREFEIVENYRPHRVVEAPIDEEALGRFVNAGFMHFPRLFSETEVLAMSEATERVADAEGVRANAGGIFLRHLMDKDPAFLDLLSHPLLVPLARLLLGPMIRALPVTARIAVPGEPNQSVDWHIHQRLVPKPLPAFFSQPVVFDVLIYLDDVDEETGPLQVVPGSHRRNLESLPTRSGDMEDQVTLMPKAGDAIMLHGNLWHRALPTTAKGRRRRLIIYPFGPAWVNLPSFGARPAGGLLDQLAASTTDPDLKELLGDCERLY